MMANESLKGLICRARPAGAGRWNAVVRSATTGGIMRVGNTEITGAFSTCSALDKSDHVHEYCRHNYLYLSATQVLTRAVIDEDLRTYCIAEARR